MRPWWILFVLLSACRPEPVRLLPLPDGVEYPWVAEATYPSVPDMVQMHVAQRTLHDAVTLGAIAAQDLAASLAHQRALRRAAELRRQGRSSGSTGPPARVVDLNTASNAELQSLPRVGPAMATRIEEARPFRHASDLRRVRGVGPATWALLEPLVVVTATLPPEPIE